MRYSPFNKRNCFVFKQRVNGSLTCGKTKYFDEKGVDYFMGISLRHNGRHFVFVFCPVTLVYLT